MPTTSSQRYRCSVQVMKIVKLETFPVSVPYRHTERSSRVQRGGVSDVIVKLTADNGLVGWGESCSGADTASIEAAVRAMAPFVIGRSCWDVNDIARARLPERLVGLSHPDRQFCVRRYRHGAVGSLRKGLRPPALPALRRASA